MCEKIRACELHSIAPLGAGRAESEGHTTRRLEGRRPALGKKTQRGLTRWRGMYGVA